jgi:hypothetical protein
LLQVLDELSQLRIQLELLDKFLRSSVGFGPVAKNAENVVLSQKLVVRLKTEKKTLTGSASGALLYSSIKSFVDFAKRSRMMSSMRRLQLWQHQHAITQSRPSQFYLEALS